MRYIYQREVIRKVVYNSSSHPTADLIFHEVRKIIPEISLGTVYRNLKQLEKNNIIKAIEDSSATRYDCNTEPHHHFKCEKCGELVDVVTSVDDVILDLEAKYNFKIKNTKISFLGFCKKHRKKRST